MGARFPGLSEIAPGKSDFNFIYDRGSMSIDIFNAERGIFAKSAGGKNCLAR